jgi:DNA-binding NtrC family response regulator
MVEQRVLAVDDDPAALEAIVALLQTDGYEVHTATSAEEAESILAGATFPLIITDLILPGKSGIDLVRHAADTHPHAFAIVVTGHATLPTAVEALKAGAIDYLTKPVDPGQLRGLIAGLLGDGEEAPDPAEVPKGSMAMSGMTSRCAAMRAVHDKVRLAAQTDSTVLLQGESGSGKELCARAIHHGSRRSAGPFVPLAAAGIPPERLLEELFGKEEDGKPLKIGKVDQARGGTLLIEEIDTLDAAAQGALLGLLDTGRFVPVGGAKAQAAELRLMASTHRSLPERVRAGAFREDLYYRLSIFPIELPPLRQRQEDIPLLTQEFLAHFAERYRKPPPLIPPQTMELLLGYAWPGNVRELRNVIEHAVILCTADELGPDLLPRMLHQPQPEEDSIQIPIGTKMREIERTVISRTLDAYRWNKNKTAKILGISRRSLYNKLDRYHITRAEQKVAMGEESAAAPSPAADGNHG